MEYDHANSFPFVQELNGIGLLLKKWRFSSRFYSNHSERNANLVTWVSKYLACFKYTIKKITTIEMFTRKITLIYANKQYGLFHAI